MEVSPRDQPEHGSAQPLEASGTSERRREVEVPHEAVRLGLKDVLALEQPRGVGRLRASASPRTRPPLLFTH